jgi:hypothetical protein
MHTLPYDLPRWPRYSKDRLRRHLESIRSPGSGESSEPHRRSPRAHGERQRQELQRGLSPNDVDSVPHASAGSMNAGGGGAEGGAPSTLGGAPPNPGGAPSELGGAPFGSGGKAGLGGAAWRPQPTATLIGVVHCAITSQPRSQLPTTAPFLLAFGAALMVFRGRRRLAHKPSNLPRKKRAISRTHSSPAG